MNRQERSHRREGRADQHSPAIAALYADHRQGNGRACSEPSADRDRQEMHRTVDLDLLGPEKVEHRDWADGAGAEHDERREASLPQQRMHTGFIERDPYCLSPTNAPPLGGFLNVVEILVRGLLAGAA